MKMNWDEKNPSSQKMNYSATINKAVIQHGFDWIIEDAMKNLDDNFCRDLRYANSSQGCMMNCRHDESLLCCKNWLLAICYDYQLFTSASIHVFTYWDY